MKRAKLLPSAKADLLEIFVYIATRSQSVRTAQKFDRRLRDYCNHLAYLPFQMGKERLDLDPELRSIAFEDYVLFMRYRNDRLEVVNIIEGHRDMPGYFSK